MSYISKRQQAALDESGEVGNPIKGVSPAEAEQYVIDHVTDLASARNTMRIMARILALHQRYIELLAQQIKHE